MVNGSETYPRPTLLPVEPQLELDLVHGQVVRIGVAHAKDHVELGAGNADLALLEALDLERGRLQGGARGEGEAEAERDHRSSRHGPSLSGSMILLRAEWWRDPLSGRLESPAMAPDPEPAVPAGPGEAGPETPSNDPGSPIPSRAHRILAWLMKGHGPEPEGDHQRQTYPWWQVMCLTGVDYFSTLGYQPGIAFLAAGVLSPVATLHPGARDPVRGPARSTRQVARDAARTARAASPCSRSCCRAGGARSCVLVLLGFAFTDFIITITLSAADATAHIIENPFVPALRWTTRCSSPSSCWPSWAASSCRASSEAIGLAVVIVAVYLVLNAVLLGGGRATRSSATPSVLAALAGRPASPRTAARWAMLGVALAPVPQAGARPVGLRDRRRGDAAGPGRRRTTTRSARRGRIRNTRKLLLTAAVIMSVFLMLLELRHHAADPAAGVRRRAARPTAAPSPTWPTSYLGDGFGTALRPLAPSRSSGSRAPRRWPALLNLVPRYLPPYGMAPDWARADRPLVLVFTADRLRRDHRSSTPTWTPRAAPTPPACWC